MAIDIDSDESEDYCEKLQKRDTQKSKLSKPIQTLKAELDRILESFFKSEVNNSVLT